MSAENEKHWQVTFDSATTTEEFAAQWAEYIKSLPGSYDGATGTLNMGSALYSPLQKRARSDAYYRFDGALDRFEEWWQEGVYSFTNPMRAIARKVDDKFGGGK